MTIDIRLVRPSVAYEATFLRALDAFQREGLPWWRGPGLDLARSDFARFVAAKLAEATPDADDGSESGRVPKTQLWAIAGAELVGRIGIFHRLTEQLRRDGGHIGYDTVPSWRGRGVATAMLREGLAVARGLGLNEVLLTCDEGNAASIAVIEKNGGSGFERRSPGPGRPMKRYYWLATTK